MKRDKMMIYEDMMILVKGIVDNTPINKKQEKKAECYDLLLSFMEYGMRGIEPENLNGMLRIYFDMNRNKIDKCNQNYINRVKHNTDTKLEYEYENVNITPQTEPPPKKQLEEKTNIKSSYGNYKRVWLSVQEVEELKKIYDTTQINTYINKVDEYKERTGKEYKSDYLTIVKWITEDKDKTKTKVSENSFNKFEQHEYNYDELEKQLLSN